MNLIIARARARARARRRLGRCARGSDARMGFAVSATLGALLVNLNVYYVPANYREDVFRARKIMTLVRGVRAPRLLWNLDHLEHGFAHDAVHADDVVAGLDQAENVPTVDDGVAHHLLRVTAVASPRRIL